MKQLKCEMCGSTDLIKQDGVYVCQSCGCKYTVEEAKKLMVEVEGNVDVSGSTVKVDTSEELENLYQIARRARDENNAENAAKYYDMILVKDPTSWEAAFYTVYFKAEQCRIMDIASAANSVANCIFSVLNLIKENVEEANQEKAVTEVSTRCVNIFQTFMTATFNNYKDINNDIRAQYNQQFSDRMYATANIMFAVGDCVDNLFNNDNNDQYRTISTTCWDLGIKARLLVDDNIYKGKIDNVNEQYITKIKKYNPSYENPSTQTQKTTNSQSAGGGCYIATAVYGSYDCPQVWTLRRYRDYVLADSCIGRVFIKGYYAVSPMLVKWFGETKIFKKTWKCVLDCMVERLNENGIKNGPYEDKEW